MGKYRRVTLVDRCHIFLALNSGQSIPDLAKKLGFNKSTLYRELKRNGSLGGQYDPFVADGSAAKRFRFCCRKQKILGELEDFIQYFLFESWSPEQISGRLKRENSSYQVSHQTIYHFLKTHRRDLLIALKRYNRRGAGRIRQQNSKNKGQLKISDRPIEIANRQRVGDFERDGMRFSKIKAEVLVCADRKTRFTKIGLCEEMKPKKITELTMELLKGERLKTLTNDNGLEFRDSKSLEVPVYFCEPGRPDQRGTIENTIGRLRFDLPLKCDPREFDLKAIEDKHNHSPRKCLDYQTPYEAFYGKSVALAP